MAGFYRMSAVAGATANGTINYSVDQSWAHFGTTTGGQTASATADASGAVVAANSTDSTQKSYALFLDANTGTNARTATVTVTDQTTGDSKTISITQHANGLNVSPTTLTFSASGAPLTTA
jgi:hypothetical protein